MLPLDSSPLWLQGSSRRYEPLTSDLTVDVAVVGAGITGLTTAALLARNGAEVAVIEAERVGWGTSGRTTAKVSALQGTRYRTLAARHGATTAQAYALAQRDALAWMERQVTDREIRCSWEERPAITYATDAESRTKVVEEQQMATDAGLATRFVDELPELPFDVDSAVVLDHQAQFDPLPYLEALAAEVDAAPGCSVHEGTRATGVRGLGTVRVQTSHGRVRARYVVLATLLPIVDRGLFFARAEPKASYTMALRVGGDLPQGMYLSASQPTRSLRTVSRAGQDLLVVGGNGHVVGRERPTMAQYQDLFEWASTHFDVQDIVARWMAHDYVPVDHLPWVGQAWPRSPGLLVATGFEKWGMTGGTAAALALADRIAGSSTGPSAAWASIFDPGRLDARALTSTVRLNGGVAAELASGWLHPDSPATGPGNDGRRRRRGVVPSGTTAGDDASEGSVVCTHLGGPCTWNDAERTWDCPLHGSRFSAEGEVLTGPATARLHRQAGTDPTA